MKRVGTFMTGLLVGVALFGGSAAYAAGITVEQSTNRFLVDGQEVQLQAYTINGANYLKLRDIGKAVGFNVYCDVGQHCVQIERNATYTGAAPADSKSETTRRHGRTASRSPWQMVLPWFASTYLFRTRSTPQASGRGAASRSRNCSTPALRASIRWKPGMFIARVHSVIPSITSM